MQIVESKQSKKLSDDLGIKIDVYDSVKMRIATWNINGIRSLHNIGTWRTALKKIEADIVCLQETKITSKC